ncbi:MAG: hypothetical protein EOS11_25725 [Mesorhizobium sp.]|nr:MAG: hypothetical protein EOS10_27035 [Mesorhizobium sp.]RWO38141.1 MAG: hypothetical protein EOS11_25725 [Mesorhizobium sp.]TIN80168.1 MAG: hypothetical protein E5Y09_04590 [Mesorhizobium sp.]
MGASRRSYFDAGGTAPLCPARHLPHKGGDWQCRCGRPLCDVGDWRKRSRHPISPQVGEMSGRTEGGASLRHQRFCTVVTL